MTELAGWLASRQPPVPPAFATRLDVPSGTEAAPGSLTRLGAAALALTDPAARLDREAAFQLLAADAYVTYACEAAADEDDPGSALAAVLEHVVDPPPHE